MVRVQHRGLFCWRETALVDALIPEVIGMQPDATEQWARETLRAFMDKIYYQLRNLGQSSPDRALNYVATNAFTFATGIRSGLISSKHVPGGSANLYTLDTVTVTKSPYCRMDSDCWDVQVKFFDPDNDRRARAVYLYTVDVSDEMPVSLAPTHEFLVASP